MRTGIFAVAITILLVVMSSAVGYYEGDSTNGATTMTSTATATSTITTTTQQTLLETVTATPTIASAWASSVSLVTGSPCENATGGGGVVPAPPGSSEGGLGLPTQAPGYYFFLVNVDYSGQWGGIASFDDGAPTGDNGAPIACYFGNGPGIIVSATPDANSTLRLTVTKLDGSDASLAATFDSITNATVFPYGSVTLSGTPYYYTNIAGSLPFKT